ncbi:DOMON-like domain-containing protein [Brevundimonas sp. PAMC22021]|uniref:DOMON-like domain-containing protein n=1 Tax=Brevundimonas sp. PAMC22021 TaxID=2861285 RepID=UPI002106B920|nr:DOMON-like domain-containing protein [Brevundimonas sp. PAMC22021]
MAHELKPFGGMAGGLSLSVEVERRAQGLWLRFVLEGDVDAVAWPPLSARGRADDLWRHTCFEAFVRTGGGYVEFNLSPSGAWASYRFDGYRRGMVQAPERVEVSGLDGAEAYVALEGLVDLPPDAAALALSAVVEREDGRISYWALRHPSDKPDFHHPESFVLDLP